MGQLKSQINGPSTTGIWISCNLPQQIKYIYPKIFMYLSKTPLFGQMSEWMVVTSIHMLLCKVQLESTFVQARYYTTVNFSGQLSFLYYHFVIISFNNWIFVRSPSTTGKWPDQVCFCWLCQQVSCWSSSAKLPSSTGVLSGIPLQLGNELIKCVSAGSANKCVVDGQ